MHGMLVRYCYFIFFICLFREQRKARPGQKSKEHKKELAELVASQREVETLTFLDTGEDEGDVIDPVVEEATDIYGRLIRKDKKMKKKKKK